MISDLPTWNTTPPISNTTHVTRSHKFLFVAVFQDPELGSGRQLLLLLELAINRAPGVSLRRRS